MEQKDVLINRANTIINETQYFANDGPRVGGLIKDVVEYADGISQGQISLGTVASLTELNAIVNPSKGDRYIVSDQINPTNSLPYYYVWSGSAWVNTGETIINADAATKTDLTLKTSRTELINISQLNAKYDYEDSVSARNAVPATLRGIGQRVIYKLASGKWVTDLFIGASTSSWGVSTSWLDTTVGEYRNLFSRWQEFTGSWFERMLCVNTVKIYTNNISEKYYISIVRGTASGTDPVFRIRRYGDTDNIKCSVLNTELTNGVFKGIKAFDESSYAYLDLDFNKIRSTLDWTSAAIDSESEMVLTISTAAYLNNSINYTDIASIHESYLASSIVSSDEIKISQCIQNLEIHDPTGSNTFRMQQQGFSTSSNKVLFYWLRENDSVQFYQEFAIAKPDSGVLHYDYFFNGVRFVFDFNWTLYNSYFTNRYGSVGANRLFTKSKDARYSNFNDMSISRGMLSASVRTEANVNLMLCISNLKLQSYTSNHIGRFQLRQFGYSTTSGYPIFYVQEISSGVIYEFSVSEETVLPTGQRHYDLDNNVLHLSFDFDWDVYAKYFTNRYGFTGIYVMSTLYSPVYNLGKAVSIKSGSKIMLTGASFASSENGWFELFCLKNNMEAVNQAVGGSGIETNVAQRMLDADETKPHGSLFMVNGVDIFKDIKVFVLFHSHNYDVFISESKYKSNTIDHYKTNGLANRGEVFDYIIKQYRQWCAEYTITLNINGQADVTGGKECNIVLCSHWHKSRSLYNNSSRKMADRYGITYCAFDDNIGFNNDTFVTANLNTDSNTTPVSGLYHQSILYSQFVDINIVGKTEIIDGVMYGWHPQRRSNTVDFGNGQESDGYYYPNIQYILCGIFGKYIKVIG